MSRLSQLKQEAYKAGKERDWERAITVYEQILDIDKKNPSLVNELGDICLKAGETARAISHFLNAASMYRKTGLVNNAVAIYKKVLRHDPDNLNAHWYLAESRAGQGLKAEGLAHVMVFLESSGEVGGELKEIFSKRCVTLLDLYHDTEEVQEKLVQVFRMWKMGLEAARAELLLACLNFAADEDAARAAAQSVVEREPAVCNYPEYGRWRILAEPDCDTAGGESAYADFGTVDLGEDAAPEPPHVAPATAPVSGPEDEPTGSSAPGGVFGEVEIDTPGPAPVVDAPAAPAVTDEASFSDLKDVIASAPEPDDPFAVDKDEDGCISIDVESGGGLDDVLAAVTTATDAADEADRGGEEASGQVNLLEQILAEDGDNLLGAAEDQVDTIEAEIGAQVGGDDEAPDRQYEMGLVYLEMGMEDQAVSAFKKAACDPEFAGRAYEMWAMTLERNGRTDEAQAVLLEGSNAEAIDVAGRLGLLYHLSRLQEKAGQHEEAAASLDRILDLDKGYMDAAARRAALPLARA